MAARDLRQFLDQLEANGELARVPCEVEVEYEIGAVLRRAADLGGPAPFFERVQGHTMSVAGNLCGTRNRIAIGLDTTPDHLLAEWSTRTASSIPPVVVKDGPCKANVLLGEDVDLRRLPAPIFNDRDGGPFITAGCHFSVDPETGIRNVGIYRNQVHGPRRLGVLAAPYRHMMLHRAARGRTAEGFPVAIALGVAPAVFLGAAADYPFGVDEMSKAGALAGEPIELVPCETVPLHVPATAEIVIEGEVLVDELIDEGPFGEFTGYYGTVGARPVIEVKAITYRDEPIYHAAYTGRPPNEDVTIAAVVKEASLIAEVGLPGLRAIHLTDGGCGYFNAVASIDKRFEGYGKMMAMAILGTWSARTIKTLIIVDADVDPYNPTEVQWALGTRMQPERDVEIMQQVTGVILDPSIPREDRLSGASRTSKMIIDATKHDAATYEIEVVPRAAVFERVVREWERYAIPSRGQLVRLG